MTRTAWLWWHGRSRSHENFLTEAVALSTELDHRPMATVVAASIGCDPASIVAIRAETQFPVGAPGAGDGKVDLRLVCATPGAYREVWVEVKASAGLHGRQLETYERARNHGTHLRGAGVPCVMLLGGARDPRPEDARGTGRWVPWTDLAAAIAPEHDPMWADLAAYLRKCRLA